MLTNIQAGCLGKGDTVYVRKDQVKGGHPLFIKCRVRNVKRYKLRAEVRLTLYHALWSAGYHSVFDAGNTFLYAEGEIAEGNKRRYVVDASGEEVFEDEPTLFGQEEA